ncbi:MAG TPA: hypothetical protein VH298_06725 [Jatrophihabitans sp.]|jgi:hypothetical protein|nr:hypothetical protein [Jatrophihabitans sp.]
MTSSADPPRLRLVSEPAYVEPIRPGALSRWLGLERWRCHRFGHVPVRTPSGTDCQRCQLHWNHL